MTNTLHSLGYDPDTLLLDLETWYRAWLQPKMEQHRGYQLVVLASILLRPRHQLYLPIAELISRSHGILTSEEMIIDPAFQGGRAWHREYNVDKHLERSLEIPY